MNIGWILFWITVGMILGAIGIVIGTCIWIYKSGAFRL